MLSGMASSGLAPAELRDNNTTVEPGSHTLRSRCSGQLSMYPSSNLDCSAPEPEGLDAAFRKVVPDFIIASGKHVEEASWDK